jgi:hypothetical protein
MEEAAGGISRPQEQGLEVPSPPPLAQPLQQPLLFLVLPFFAVVPEHQFACPWEGRQRRLKLPHMDPAEVRTEVLAHQHP